MLCFIIIMKHRSVVAVLTSRWPLLRFVALPCGDSGLVDHESVWRLIHKLPSTTRRRGASSTLTSGPSPALALDLLDGEKSQRAPGPSLARVGNTAKEYSTAVQDGEVRTYVRLRGVNTLCVQLWYAWETRPCCVRTAVRT